MKRFYTLLILCLSVFSTLMAHDAVVNGIYYNLDTTNKTAEVTYKGDSSSDEEYSGSVNIPASITYNGVSYKVLSIGENAFYGCVNMTSIKIAEGIQEIGEYAFYGCGSLTSIEFPNSVTTIGNSVFANYLNINGNNYPKVILRHITLGSGLTKVGTDAFGCAISSSLDEGAEVHYKGTADSWAKINFANKYANPLHDATDLHINGELLTEANITSATSISAYAFINCTSLTSVKMGSSVQKIGIEAFKGCNNLKKVTCYATTVPTVYSTSFSNYNAYLYVPCASKEDYDLHNIFGSFKYVECVTDEEGDNNGGNSGTTPTPTPTPDTTVAPLYVKGGFNNWEINDTYKLASADGNYYVANYSAGNEITISGNFKISNEDWSVNYGGAFVVEAGKSYTLTAGGANLDTAGKIKASKVEFTLSTGVLKITGTTSSNEFDTTTDQGVAFVVNPRGASPVYVPLTHSYNAEFQTAQYNGTYTVTELGVTAKIGGLTNFNVIDYGTNGQPVMPKFVYDMVKGAYEGFTIEGDYKVGDVLNILVLFDKDWNSSILINVQEAGTNPTPDPKPEPEPTPGGEITLYYVNKTGWSAVNAYVWDEASGTPIVAWSGEPATKLDKTVDGNEVYSYTFDSSLADRIIFNNGNGGVGNQTDDLTFEASKPYFYDGVWYETLTFDTNSGGTVDPNPTPDPKPEPEPEPDPAVPAFVVAGNGGSDATGIWCNGIEWNATATANQMTDADKDGIFEITYSNVPTGTWSFKVVVNTEPQQWLGGEFLDKVNSSAGYTIQNGGNIGFTLSNAADVTIKIDSADGKITLTTPSGNFGKVKIDYFTVANTDECLVENRFTAANNNTLKYTVDIQVSEESGFGYAPFRILGNCNYAVYENSLLVEVTESGKYEVTIVFNGDYENPEFTITYVKQGSTTEPDTPVGPNIPVDPDTPVKPEPEPDPVVAIKNLMIQPFEKILPKTTTTTVATFTLQNASTATVTIEGLDADFFEIGEQNITEGECSVQIMFNPFVKGVYYGTLTVTTDDNVSLSIDFAAVCGDETFEPGDVPELNPDPVNPGSPDDDTNVSVEEVSAVMIYAKEGTIYSEVEFEIYDLAGVNVTKLNGSLQGVYIVKTAEGNRLVSVW